MLRSLKEGVLNLLREGSQKYNEGGISGLVLSIPGYIHYKLTRYLSNVVIWLVPRAGLGKNWYEEEWDLLIILDTCRVDAMESVSENHEFITDIHKTLSKGGQSAEWMVNTFTENWEDEIANTALVSSNPHARSVFENELDSSFDDTHNSSVELLSRFGISNFVSKDDFGHYETFWQLEGEHGQRLPRPVTDHAIEVARESDYERMIVHYMPPHSPYVAEAKEEDRPLNEYENNPFSYLRETGDRKTVFNSHVANLEWILEEVELLLNNVDAENVIITADHGDGFGEYGLYRHRAGHLSPKVRVIPWVETSAVDSRSHEPSSDRETTVEQSQKEALKALGYIQ